MTYEAFVGSLTSINYAEYYGLIGIADAHEMRLALVAQLEAE